MATGNSFTLQYQNTPWIGTDIVQSTNSILANNNTFTGLNTFTQVIGASGGITGSTGYFSGLLSAAGGITGQDANFSTGEFSGLLSAAGGITGSTGYFSGLLSADGGFYLPADQNLTVLGTITRTTDQGVTGITGQTVSLDLGGVSLNNFKVTVGGETGLSSIGITGTIVNSEFNIYLSPDGATGLTVEKTLGPNIYNNLSGQTYFSQGSKWWIRGTIPETNVVYLVFSNVTN